MYQVQAAGQAAHQAQAIAAGKGSAKVEMSQLVMTIGIQETVYAVAPHKVMEAVTRHVRGDWGDVGPEDWASNDAAVQEGGMILSSYQVAGTKIYVISDPAPEGSNLRTTTILLPSEY